jgi:hypothetical protein
VCVSVCKCVSVICECVSSVCEVCVCVSVCSV